MPSIQSQQLPGAWSCRPLMERLWFTYLWQPTTLFFLFFQPVLVALLLSMVCGSSKQIPVKLFFFHITAQWLACGNAAQVIVRERSVFLREKLAGLRLRSYLAANITVMGLVSSFQMGLMYVVLWCLPNRLDGAVGLHLLAGVCGVWVMTSIGILISAWSKNSTMAVMMVPLVIIPQILASGFVFPPEFLRERPKIALLCSLSPGQAGQRFIDMSLIWGKKLDQDVLDKSGATQSVSNIEHGLVPWRVWMGPPGEHELSAAAQEEIYLRQGIEFTDQSYKWPDETPKLETTFGVNQKTLVYHHKQALWYPSGVFGVWFALACLGAWVGLARSSNGP